MLLVAENFKELFDFYFFITGHFRFCYLGAVFFVGNDFVVIVFLALQALLIYVSCFSFYSCNFLIGSVFACAAVYIVASCSGNLSPSDGCSSLSSCFI